MLRHNVQQIVINMTGLGVLFSTLLAQAETEHPHTIGKNSKSMECSVCHKTDPVLNAKLLGVSNGVLDTRNNPVDRASFNKNGTDMCSSCHNPDDGHKVGLKLDFQVPADLPLDKKNTMTCLTCHYTHGSLTSERPQASHSFIDRIFDAERLHKSFFLRRNNTDGELCLTCHNVNQGSK